MLIDRKKNSILRLTSGIFSVVLLVVIYIFSAQPGSASDDVSISLTALLLSRSYDSAAILNCIVREVAHALEFGALALPVCVFTFTFNIGRKAKLCVPLVFCALCAVADEIHQIFVEGRACEIYDMVVDFLGALVVIVFMHFLLKNVKVSAPAENTILSAEAEKTLCLFSDYINGVQSSVEITPDEFGEIVSVAGNQKIIPVIAENLIVNSSGCDENSVKLLKNTALSQIVLQTEKTRKFLLAYGQMRVAGVSPVCVKGIICRSLYPDIDVRISADEDLFIKPSEVEICSDILLNLGFKKVDSGKEKDEIHFFDSASGCLIELHLNLFPDDGSVYSRFNAALGDMSENAVTVSIDSTDILSPQNSKHLTYLILHAFKHFLIAGVGIRQIADISLFAKNFEIDWGWVFSTLSPLNACGFASAVLCIGAEYFGLDVSGIKKQTTLFDESTDYSALLYDVMTGGVYGSKAKDRVHSGEFVINRYASSLSSKGRNVLFPSYSAMKQRYPYLEKKPYLLPFAWFKRIVNALKVNDNYKKSLDTGKKRLALLEKYGIAK